MLPLRILLVTLFALTSATALWAEAEKPNVVFILADDMGFSDLGCYGGEIETPNLDRLAAGGLRYTQFYNTARCWPTRAALLTGYYAQQVRRDKLPGAGGGGGNRNARPKWARLLPDLLKPHGYRCYHSGKWHIDGPVLAGGFDRSLDTRNQGNFFSSNGNRLNDKPVVRPKDESGYYTTIATVDHAIECLEDHAANHKERPFFQYVAFIAPHFPLHALPEDIEKYQGVYDMGWDAMRAKRFARQQEMGLVHTTLSELEEEVGPPYDFPNALKELGDQEVKYPLPWDELTQRQQAFQAAKMSIHAAMVDRMDQEIGRLVAQLEKMNALDNTIIFCASDNGASAEIMIRAGGHDPTAPLGSAATYLCLGPGFSSACNTPFRRHKSWVHEGGIATPLIVHWPQGIAAQGELRNTPAHVIDFVPTILDVLEAKKPSTWNGESIPPAPGKSLADSFANDVTIEREFLWWLHGGNRAVRQGNWKIVAAEGDPWELYNLESDRAEANNLIADHPDKAKKLETLWNRQVQETIALVSQSAKKPAGKKQ